MRDGKLKADRESQEAIRASVQDTLETMAFAEVMPVDKNRLDLSQMSLIHLTRVAIRKPFHGCLSLCMSEKLARNLAASILGITQEPDEAIVRDTLLELTNIIGGRVVALLVDPHVSFDLGIPEAAKLKKPLPSDRRPLIEEIFRIDEEYLLVSLECDSRQVA